GLIQGRLVEVDDVPADVVVDRRAEDLTGRSIEGAGAGGDGDVIGAAVGLVGRQQRGAGDRAAQQLEGALALQLVVQHQRAHRVQRAHLVAGVTEVRAEYELVPRAAGPR